MQIEVTGKRDLNFSGFIRKNLLSSEAGLVVSDVDYYIYNYKTKQHRIVEVKLNSKDVSDWQHNMYQRMSKWLKKGGEEDGWTWEGYLEVRIAGENPEEDKIYCNNTQVSKEELIRILNFFDAPPYKFNNY